MRQKCAWDEWKGCPRPLLVSPVRVSLLNIEDFELSRWNNPIAREGIVLYGPYPEPTSRPTQGGALETRT